MIAEIHQRRLLRIINNAPQPRLWTPAQLRLIAYFIEQGYVNNGKTYSLTIKGKEFAFT